VRHVAVVLVVALACAGCGSSSKHAVATTTAAQPDQGFAIEPPVPAPGFSLRDERGVAIGPQNERGHVLVVTFLYTHCPDVCPLIANNLAAAQRRDADLRVIAVSVDPKRDTRTAIRGFLKEHHAGPRFHFVGGTRAQLQPVWRRYHIAALPGPSGTVSHSSFSVLVDRSGSERRLFDASVTAAAVVAAAGRLR
jgi:protein SCO1/2